MKRIIVTGATGQIGSELVQALRDIYGADNVIAAGHRKKPSKELLDPGPFITLDVRDGAAFNDALERFSIDTVFHLASLLSFIAEGNPHLAWEVNMGGLTNALEAARKYGCAIFFPSSIGAFGPTTPHDDTPQDTIQRPDTMYGITKVTGELLCDYYYRKYKLDARGLRYPGLISYKTEPGGGTTDYAVEIFYSAIRKGAYSSPLKEGTRLDMMYMPDAIRAAMELMEADPASLRHRNAFNLTAMNFTPEELCREIKRHIPGFEMTYDVDPLRQAIAESWPRHMDDSAARSEWGWMPEYDISSMTADMIEKLSKKTGVK
ncbi:MAG: NAD-dependent epimerase/dehydratase family protein [bacterium]|nr:NAD-dependent epimerase/dehydratase family protein [bacterium]